MNANKSKRFDNVLARAIAAAGILGGAAPGLAAGANADTATTAQAHQGRVARRRPATRTRPISGRALPLVPSTTGHPCRPPRLASHLPASALGRSEPR